MRGMLVWFLQARCERIPKRRIKHYPGAGARGLQKEDKASGRGTNESTKPRGSSWSRRFISTGGGQEVREDVPWWSAGVRIAR